MNKQKVIAVVRILVDSDQIDRATDIISDRLTVPEIQDWGFCWHGVPTKIDNPGPDQLPEHPHLLELPR